MTPEPKTALTRILEASTEGWDWEDRARDGWPIAHREPVKWPASVHSDEEKLAYIRESERDERPDREEV